LCKDGSRVDLPKDLWCLLRGVEWYAWQSWDSSIHIVIVIVIVIVIAVLLIIVEWKCGHMRCHHSKKTLDLEIYSSRSSKLHQQWCRRMENAVINLVLNEASQQQAYNIRICIYIYKYIFHQCRMHPLLCNSRPLTSSRSSQTFILHDPPPPQSLP